MPPPGGAFVPGAPGPGGPYPPMMMMPGWIPPELAQQQHQQYMEGQHGQHGYEEGQQQGEYVDTPQGGDMPEYGYQQPQGDNGGNHQGPPSPHHQDDGSQQQE